MSATAIVPPAAEIRVVVVDDGTLSRECLAAQLAHYGVTATGAWDLPTLLTEAHSAVPHVVLINIATPDSSTLLQLALDLDPDCRVIVFGLSTDRESEIIACAEAGIAGLHLRTESFDQLLSLISAPADTGAQCSPEVSAILLRRVYAFAAQAHPDATTDLLTPREIEILELIDRGLTNQQIASRLSLTLHTVKNHVHNLLGKLGVGSRAEAVSVFRATRYANPGG